MRLEINPRVDGKFVEQIMHSPHVKEHLDHIPEELEIDKHALVKSVLISGLTKFEFNLSKEIDKIKHLPRTTSQPQ